MSDLIDRNAVMLRVKKFIGNPTYDENMLVNDLNALPSAEPEPKWIPVTERLPKKENKSYWVCTDTKYQCECRWTNNIYGIGESSEWGWKIFDIPQYTKVVAWMQLPKPYRGEV